MLKVLKKTALWFPIVSIVVAFILALLCVLGFLLYILATTLHDEFGVSYWFVCGGGLFIVWLAVSLIILEKE